MTRKIRTRIEKLEYLESQVPRQQTSQEIAASRIIYFMRLATACHLGNTEPGEAVVDAHARALGYATRREYKKALKDAIAHKDSNYIERNKLANIRVLEKFGVTLDDPSKRIDKAFKHMFEGFSDYYKQLWENEESRRAPNAS